MRAQDIRRLWVTAGLLPAGALSTAQAGENLNGLETIIFTVWAVIVAVLCAAVFALIDIATPRRQAPATMRIDASAPDPQEPQAAPVTVASGFVDGLRMIAGLILMITMFAFVAILFQRGVTFRGVTIALLGAGVSGFLLAKMVAMRSA